MFELMDSYSQNAVIKVIGVGGGGGNAVQHMVEANIEGVEFICANTDAQALSSMGSRTTLQLGNSITKGLGAGANPDVGRQAAMEDRDRIQEVIAGSDMLFITAGMGGGTGTGGAPVVAQVAKELGILTVAVVTKPFQMEGVKRSAIADHGIGDRREIDRMLRKHPNATHFHRTHTGRRLHPLRDLLGGGDSSRHGDLHVAGRLDRPFRRTDHGAAFGLETRLPGYDDVLPARQGAADGFPGLAPHDNGLAERQLLEMLQVGGQVPRQLVVAADDAVARHGPDQRDHWPLVGQLPCRQKK